MILNIKRDNDDNNGVLITTRDAYMAFVCTGLTINDHGMVKNELQGELDLESKVDLYYTRSLTSIFIFNAETLKKLSYKDIKQMIPDIKHVTIHNGAVYGSGLNDVNVTSSKKELRVRKKFQSLLTIRKS